MVVTSIDVSTERSTDVEGERKTSRIQIHVVCDTHESPADVAFHWQKEANALVEADLHRRRWQQKHGDEDSLSFLRNHLEDDLKRLHERNLRGGLTGRDIATYRKLVGSLPLEEQAEWHKRLDDLLTQ